MTDKEDVADADVEHMVSDYESLHDTVELWNVINRAAGVPLEKSYECGMMLENTYNQ